MSAELLQKFDVTMDMQLHRYNLPCYSTTISEKYVYFTVHCNFFTHFPFDDYVHCVHTPFYRWNGQNEAILLL